MDKNINRSTESYKKSDYEKFKSYERFTFLIDELTPYMKDGISLLDIGCAKGELIYLLKESIDKNIKYTGLEYSKELIDLALQEDRLQDVNFIEADAQKFDLNEQFDIVVMSGVLSIFDDIENVLDNMVKHIKPNGYGFIFGGFNIEDIDVIVRYRNNKYSDIWESGWNIFSIDTVKKYLNSYIKSFEYKKFVLKRTLEKSDNPVSSYTIKTKDEDNIILTGGGIVRDFYLLKFQKNGE